METKLNILKKCNTWMLFLMLICFSKTQAQGNALQFDAVNDNVNLGTGLNTYFSGRNQITVQAWVNIPQLAQNNGFSTPIGNYNNNALMQYMIRLQNGVPVFWLSPNTAGASGFKNVSATSVIPLNRWVHIACTWDGSAMRIYYNGILEGTTTGVTGAFPSLSVNPLRLSTTYVSEIYNGKIDEVKIWNTARTVAQIQSDMRNTASSGTAGLMAYYNFNVGTPGGTNAGLTALADQSGNNYNGTLANFALAGATSNWVESYAMVVPTALAATNINATGFTTNWTASAVGIVDAYVVEVSPSSTFPGATTTSYLNTQMPTGTSINIGGLNPATTYYYRVRADKASVTAQGAYSQTITATTLSNNADLSNLTSTAGTITPNFSSGTTSYSTTVSNATTNITITPTRAQANATISVNGNAVASGNASPQIFLIPGSTNIISIVVTAQNGTTKTYTLSVCRLSGVSAGSASAQTVCRNSAITNITRTTSGATGIGAATGLPAGVTATWAADIITISGTPTTAGTFNYNIRYCPKKVCKVKNL